MKSTPWKEAQAREQGSVITQWGFHLAALLLCFRLAALLMDHPVSHWPKSQGQHAALTSGPVLHTVDGRRMELPPPGAAVIIYRRAPHTYHWRADCPSTINPIGGEVLSLPLHKLSRIQAKVMTLNVSRREAHPSFGNNILDVHEPRNYCLIAILKCKICPFVSERSLSGLLCASSMLLPKVTSHSDLRCSLPSSHGVALSLL